MSPDVYGFADVTGANTGFLTAFLVIYLVFILLMSGYSILVYILHALGLYTIANRRGIHHPWLAWIPLGDVWILGSIGDQYQYVAKGRVKNRRKTLLGLMITVMVLILVFFVAFFIAMITAISSEYDFSVGESQMIIPAIIALVVYCAMFIIALIVTVYEYVCYYDLFASSNPNNAVTFLILSIFFSFLLPYFVFAVRKKDLGMPPRRSAEPTPPWQPASAPVEPVWQNPVQQPPVLEQPPVIQPAAEELAEVQENIPDSEPVLDEKPEE